MSSSVDNKRIAVVTGSSSGIGYETSLALTRNGYLTYATMRNLGKRDAIQSAADRGPAHPGSAAGRDRRKFDQKRGPVHTIGGRKDRPAGE
jgi:NAD(P)-dependent dehydrogenase (short-subunit alcohol dehydrogenase family)